ncbi:MAG TPA: TonB-dependent receptor [Thermoanaerobaculia bacterium]
MTQTRRFGTFTEIVALLFAAAWIQAQAMGEIRGTLKDPTGAGISGATVKATDAGGAVFEATSGAGGGFVLPALPPGAYTLSITAPGFETASRRVEVTAGGSTATDFELSLAGVREDVQVRSATRYERPLADVPVSVSVVTREEIQRTPGRSIDDVLRNVASVQLQGDSADAVFPLQPSIAMRGLGVGDTADRSLVLLDGLPLNGGFFGQVLWNRVPKETIERAEVVRGASSSLFGSFAEGGVVDIATRIPDGREGVGYVQYGENDRFQADVSVGDRFSGGRGHGSLHAQYYSTDGFYRVPEEEIRPIDERQAAELYQVGGNAGFAISETVRGFVRGSFLDQEQDGDLQLAETSAKYGSAAGGVDFDLAPGQRLALRAFWGDESYRVHNVTIVSDEETFVANPHHTTSTDFGGSAQWTKTAVATLSALTFGLDFRRVDGVDDQQVLNEPGMVSEHIVGGGVQTSLGAFGEASLKPTDRLEILLGLRFDRFEETDGRRTINGVEETFENRDLDTISPRLAARYRVSPALAARATYYEGFRAPTLAERYRSFESPTFRGLSNPFLEEEKLRGGDVGVDLQLGALSAQINGFYNRMENFVGSAEVGFENGKFTVQTANVAETRATGLELIANVRPSPQWNVTVNYTYTDAVVTDGELEGNVVEGAPRNAFSAAISWAPTATITISPSVRAVGDTYQDITNEALQDARVLVDLFASWQAHPNLALIFLGENLFDEEYVADGFGGSLGAPRQISGAVRVGF